MFYVHVSPSIGRLSIGGSVEWLVGWSVMLLLRTREGSIMGKWVPGDILGLCFCVS